MNKEEKVKAVEELKGQLADYKSIYLTDIAGLNAVQTSKLRRECFNSNVKLSVVKNTFLERAMTESENDFGELKECYQQLVIVQLRLSKNLEKMVINQF
jgi:large subunit ribosomal protein L10